LWVENGNVMPKVSGSAPRLRLLATTRASASAVAMGSKRVALDLAHDAACSAGDTVIALPLRPRLNGATIGTLTCPSRGWRRSPPAPADAPRRTGRY
jgi:hypothetical protein